MKCSLAVLVLMPLCLFQVQASGDASECCDISSDGVLTSCASCDFSSTGIVDLSYMGITEADPDTFDDAGGKSSVTEMYLQGNALAAVPETLFQEVVNIVILDLSNNSISSLHEKMFTGTSGLAGLTGNGGHQDLEKLFLQNNRIGSLPPRIFEILESITSINLGHNFLEDLDSDLFAELGTLIKLDLSCNNFSRVESNYFTGLAALKQLDLANNELSIIESAGLDPLENLENLNLSRNFFRSLPMSSFNQLGNLKELDISDNSLEHFQAGTVTGSRHPGILSLSLRNNHIESLDPDLLFSLENTNVTIYLSGNPGSSEPCFPGTHFREVKISANEMFCLNVTVSPSPTASISATMSATSSNTPTPSYSVTTTPSFSGTSTASKSATRTASHTSSITASASVTPSFTLTGSSSLLSSSSISRSPTSSASSSVTATPSFSGTSTPRTSATLSPSCTSSISVCGSATQSFTSTTSSSFTANSSVSRSPRSSESSSVATTPTSSSSGSSTPSTSATNRASCTSSVTVSSSPTPSFSSTASSSFTASSSISRSPRSSESSFVATSPSISGCSTPRTSATDSASCANSITVSRSPTPSFTLTGASSPTAYTICSRSPTSSGSGSSSLSATASISISALESITSSVTATPSSSGSSTATSSVTRSANFTSSVHNRTVSSAPTSTSTDSPPGTTTSYPSGSSTASTLVTPSATHASSITATPSFASTKSTLAVSASVLSPPLATVSSSVTIAPSSSITSGSAAHSTGGTSSMAGSLMSASPNPSTMSSSLTASISFSVFPLTGESSSLTSTTTASASLTTTRSETATGTNCTCSRTASLTTTAPPTSSSKRHGSVSAGPSRVSLVDSTRTSSATPRKPLVDSTMTPTPTNIVVGSNSSVVSSCGDVATRDCATVIFAPVIHARIDSENMDATGLQTPMAEVEIWWQTFEYETPTFEISCQKDLKFDEEVTVFSSCNPDLSLGELGLPLGFSTQVTKNESCQEENTPSCRHASLRGNFFFHKNATKLFRLHWDEIQSDEFPARMRRLADVTIAVPLTVSVATTKESILSFTTEISVALSESFFSLPKVDPKQLSVSRNRSTVFAQSVSTDVELTVTNGQSWKWSASTRVLEFISLPKDGVARQTKSYQQTLRIDVSKAPVGETLSDILAEVFENGKLHSSLSVGITVSIYQANIGLGTSSIEVHRSTSEPPLSSSIMIGNSGQYRSLWLARLFSSNGTEMSNDQGSWATLPIQNGEIAAGEEPTPIIPVTFSSQKVESTGLFDAWVLIEVDAWEATSEIIPPRWNVQSIQTSFNQFWFRLLFRVTSIFVCEGASKNVTLRPFETKLNLLTVVNTEIVPIRVFSDNFTMTAHFLNGTTDNDAGTFFFVPSLKERNRVFSSWLRTSPVSQFIGPGLSKSFRIDLQYTTEDLLTAFQEGNISVGQFLPGTVDIHFKLFVFLGGHWRVGRSKADDVRSSAVSVAFSAGWASSFRSVVRSPSLEPFVGEQLTLSVRLLDQFGNEPASAIVGSIPADLATDSGATVLALSVRNAEDDSSALPAAVDFPLGLQNGKQIKSFTFGIRFVTVGSVFVDVKINGSSIDNAPRLLKGQPVLCERENEIPGSDGLRCLCVAGHYREEETERCVPCSEGFYSNVASNAYQCKKCPVEYFSGEGSSVCVSCPRQGVKCNLGRLRMRQGFWCEMCYDLGRLTNASRYTSPREAIVLQLENGNAVRFHECRNPRVCFSNSTTFATQCTEGHHGVLCEQCERNFAYVPETKSCVRCNDPESDYTVTTVSCVSILGVIVFLSYQYSSADERVSASDYGRSFVGHQPDKATDASKAIVRSQKNVRLSIIEREQDEGFESAKAVGEVAMVYIDYLQIVSLLSSLRINPFRGSSSWLSQVSGLSLFNPTQSAPFQCATRMDFFESGLMSMTLPWSLALLIMLIQPTIAWLRKRSFDLRSLLKCSVPVVITVFNIVYASVTEMTIASFRQYPHEIFSRERMWSDLSIEIGSSRQVVLFAVATATMVAFVFGFPVTTSIVLVRQLGNFASMSKTMEVYERYGNLIGGFRLSRKGYLWPTIVIVRKVLLLLISTFTSKPLEQLAFVTGILLVSYVMAELMSPYRVQSLTSLELGKLFFAFSTTCFGALLFALSGDLRRTGETLKTLVEVLVVVTQVVVLVLAVSLAMSLLPAAYSDARQYLDDTWNAAKEWVKQLNCICCSHACWSNHRYRAQIAPENDGAPREGISTVSETPPSDQRFGALEAWTSDAERHSTDY
eukprot:gb/GECG01011730.1/.p1 GENE.gb/GECG01011730.1/~~gb/GECG01011730.1/.p1  ORF type:complete len:2264 (+),score=212.61 gb/GECG01011730.1/:1-6792(+)